MKVTNVNVWMIGGSADVKAVKSAVRSAVDGSFCFGSEKIAMYRAVKAVRKEMERQANEVKNSPPVWMVVSFETLSGLPWMKRRSWGYIYAASAMSFGFAKKMSCRAPVSDFVQPRDGDGRVGGASFARIEPSGTDRVVASCSRVPFEPKEESDVVSSKPETGLHGGGEF